MKLHEIFMEAESTKTTKGTYAGVYFDEDTKQVVQKFIKDNDIPKPVNVDKLHTTLLYSRKFLPEYEALGELDEPLIGTPDELVVWKTQGDGDKPPSNCLVLKYDCPDLVSRHKELMKEHGATFDYEEYNPHITLSYDIGDLDIDELTDVKKAIKRVVICEEYGEDLKLDWAHKAHE